MRYLPRGKEQRIRMHCAQCKPPETQCGAMGSAIRSTEEQTGHMNTPQRSEKERKIEKEHEEHKTSASPAGNNGVLSENKKPRRVRHTPEANTGKRPRTGDHGMDVRPRVTTIMIKLLSESTQAAEMANESEGDITRWRTSILLYAAPKAYYLANPRSKRRVETTKKTESKKATK